MDKYEYKIRAEEINALIEKKQYSEAVKIADEIDWRYVKNISMICKISDLYKLNRQYEDSRDILLIAYEKLSEDSPRRSNIIYSLCELCIKLDDIVQAIEYLKQFRQIAAKDPRKFILQYKLYEQQETNLEERIDVLKKYKSREYREKWAYELAYLYHRVGLKTECVEECDELIVTFGMGRYVIKAMELKMLHEPLTPAQQEKYDLRNQRKVAAAMQKTAQKTEELADTLPISIKSIDASTAPTTRIPSKQVAKEAEKEEAMAETKPVAVKPEAIPEVIEEPAFVDEVEESKPVELAETQEVAIPVEETQPEEKDEMDDIEVKPIDFGEYATINLQQEIAKNLTNLLAEEDMEATDATKALPIEKILDSTDPELMKEITDDSIKNAIVAPLLQDTQEMTPITEEDLLASLTEKPLTVDELGKEEPEVILRPEPLPETVEAVVPDDLLPSENVYVSDTESVSESDDVLEEKIIEEFLSDQEEETVSEKFEADDVPVVSAKEEPIIEEAPVAKDEPTTEEAPVAKDEPTTEEAPVAEEEPITEEAPVAKDEPTTEEAPVAKDEPTTEETPIAEEPSESEQVDEQITGQLSFMDIMAEWEETKKATEEKHKEEMRQRILKQTGPILADLSSSDSDESSEFDLISPVLDVFTDSEEPEKTEKDLSVEEETSSESSSLFDDAIHYEKSLSSQEDAIVESLASAPTRLFDTQEIRGIEEKLLDSLSQSQQKEEAIPELVTPDITSESVLAEEAPADVQSEIETVTQTENEPVEVVDENQLQEHVEEKVESEQPQEASSKLSVMADANLEVKDLAATGPISAGRLLEASEKERFADFAHTPDMERQIAYAIDHDSLTSLNGNLLISGGMSSGTVDLAKSLVKQIQQKNPAFSGKVAKIKGSILDKKDIEKTFSTIENGALIVEKAGELSKETCGKILSYISMLPMGKGVFVIFEDTKASIDSLLTTSPELKQSFDIRIDMQAMDNDSLVNYGRDYALEQEYAIDDMGMLALYTRIADMQTNDHHVSVDEVKEIVDEAIEKANKKSVGHLVDVLLAKRYDSEDMIILREKDFMKDR